MAQDAAHRALRASQRAELKRLDLAAAGQEGGSLADKASSQIVTAQTVVDAWRDALLKVKAVRARTGGGWRAEVAGRTRQTSARLLESQPLDEAALRASLSPREQRLQRIVHEVAVHTLNLTLTLTLTLALTLTLSLTLTIPNPNPNPNVAHFQALNEEIATAFRSLED